MVIGSVMRMLMAITKRVETCQEVNKGIDASLQVEDSGMRLGKYYC